MQKVQNTMERIVQRLLPGVSGLAGRGILGMWDIRTEIDKWKLFFLGLLLRSTEC